jgi:transmembrane sensor
MTSELEDRLRRGPLRVRSIFMPRPPAEVARRVLRRRRTLATLDVAVAAACLILAVAWMKTSAARRPVAEVVVPANPIAAADAPRVVAFADGSRAELSDDQAELRVDQDGPRLVVASLKGAARFDVVPNAARAFEVHTGDVRVRVLGTRFLVRELAVGQTQISVDRGRVQVEWVGGIRTLVAGQSGVFPPPPSAALDQEPAKRETAVNAPKPERAVDGWRDYAAKGEYDRAYVELNQKGRAAVRDEPADLMLAADVARLSSHPLEALAPLRKLCDVYPADKRAPVAAFTLGRVLLDDLGRATEAAAAFEKARVLWPSGPLAEDALAREVEAWKRAGNAERARAAGDQYLRQYPAGRHAAALRKSAP